VEEEFVLSLTFLNIVVCVVSYSFCEHVELHTLIYIIDALLPSSFVHLYIYTPTQFYCP
jgi:hypothetical protein